MLLTLVTILEAVELEEVEIIVCLVRENALLGQGLDDNCGDEKTIGFLSIECLKIGRNFIKLDELNWIWPGSFVNSSSSLKSTQSECLTSCVDSNSDDFLGNLSLMKIRGVIDFFCSRKAL